MEHYIDVLEPFLFFTSIFSLFRDKITYPFIVVILLFDSIHFFGTFSSQFLFEHQLQDTALILLTFICFRLSYRRKQIKPSYLKYLKIAVIIFLLFFMIAAMVDLLVNEVALTSIFRIFRTWCCFIFLWFLQYLRQSEVHKILRYCLYISVFISGLFIIEFVFNLDISGVARSNLNTRASIPWLEMFFVYLLLLVDYYKISFRFKWFSVIIILSLIVLTGSRSIFAMYAMGTIFAFFFKDNRVSLRKLVYAVLAVLFFAGIFMTDNIINERYAAVDQDVKGLRRTNASVEGNFSFRMILLTERMNYINKKSQYVVFGIGCVQEKDLKKRLFYIGLRNERGRIVQLDTGDIAWALLFLRFGYVGTGIYVIAIFGSALYLCRKNKSNIIIFCSYVFLLLNLLMLSMTYSYIATSHFWLLPILTMRLIATKDNDPSIRFRSRRQHLETHEPQPALVNS